MTAKGKPSAEQKEIYRLFSELMSCDKERKKLDHDLTAAYAKIEELKRHHKAEISKLVVEKAELMAQATVHKRATKRATLIKLDGYLMALSEIGNDGNQGRSNQLRGGEDQPEAGQDGDHPDAGDTPE